MSFFLIVERYPRTLQNCLAPWVLLCSPETFCFTLTIRISRSAKLLSKGTILGFMKNPSTSGIFFSLKSRFLAGLCFLLPCFPVFVKLGGLVFSSSSNPLLSWEWYKVFNFFRYRFSCIYEIFHTKKRFFYLFWKLEFCCFHYTV